MKKRLNIGCRIDWRKKSEGWICNDILPFKFLIEATKYKYGDVIDFNDIDYKKFDLLKLPYPFKDNIFDEVLAKGILEYFSDEKLMIILRELHRILKLGGIITIQTPHVSNYNAFIEPGQISYYSVNKFNFLYTPYFGFLGMFERPKIKLTWKNERYNKGYKKLIARLVNKIINISPPRMERYLAPLIGGLEEIWYELKVKK